MELLAGGIVPWNKYRHFHLILENHWLHMVREVSDLRGKVSILIGMVMGLCAFVVGVWAIEVLK